jgi:hypothetical protein
MVRAVGLFPYITPHLSSMAISDRLAYEAHRVEGVEQGMVFHHLQAHVFSLIMQGRNVVLSASTSVGKSLVIDAVLAQRRFKKVVVIVPTIALIDETRRRLVKRFKDFNLITHPSQESVVETTNVYLLTQERVIQRPDLADVEFFVLDEFYKIDLGNSPDESTRAVDLSLAFTSLQKLVLSSTCSGLTFRRSLVWITMSTTSSHPTTALSRSTFRISIWRCVPKSERKIA